MNDAEIYAYDRETKRLVYDHLSEVFEEIRKNLPIEDFTSIIMNLAPPDTAVRGGCPGLPPSISWAELFIADLVYENYKYALDSDRV
ncbi:hypothetical protein EVAR_71616_1 [Eumeta japonica]|uniref:Uncharacterized protein n=1 Tax=Eumeta variegata TaxID=151549 RepID=A0A4C1SVA7_EUMVA|nr:hypothetical protein EVAR_71616_1 [Eumeta japonica]